MVKLDQPPFVYHNYDTSSIQTTKRKRAKRGSIVSTEDAALMLKRLQNGFNRLPQHLRGSFMEWIELELEKDSCDV
jgi:hypothetical protein